MVLCYKKQLECCCGFNLQDGVNRIKNTHVLVLVGLMIATITVINLENIITIIVLCNTAVCSILWLPRIFAHCQGSRKGLYYTWHCTWIMNLMVAIFLALFMVDYFNTKEVKVPEKLLKQQKKKWIKNVCDAFLLYREKKDWSEQLEMIAVTEKKVLLKWFKSRHIATQLTILQWQELEEDAKKFEYIFFSI